MELTQLLNEENMAAMRKQEYERGRKEGWACGWRDALLWACQAAYLHGAPPSQHYHGDLTRVQK